MAKIIRIGQPQTFERYEAGLRKIIPYHIRKSKTNDTVDHIIQTFKEGLNRADKLNGVVLNEEEKVIGFFISRLDTMFFAEIDSQQYQPVIFIEHMYSPDSSVGDVYKSIRKKFRDEVGAKDVFMFTHRSPEAWIKFSREQHGVFFDVYGHILVDRLKEDK